MLPVLPDWKKELDDAAKMAAEGHAEAQERQIENQNAMAAPLSRLANEFVRYEDETRRREEGKRRREIAITWGLFTNAALVLIIAMILGGQLYEAHRAYEPIEESAITARKAADVAEETLKMSQAPILTLNSWEPKNIEVGKTPSFRVNLVNVGHTVATLIESASNLTYQIDPMPSPNYIGNTKNIILPPNGGHYINLDFIRNPLSQPQFDQLTSTQVKLLVWGRLTFKNVFNEIWDYGYLVQFAPSKTDDGKWTWADTYPTIPGYTFLTKRAD
jgi:hypothetical protein